jgi:uncharacterized repeat protein (TIGR01451 family)
MKKPFGFFIGEIRGISAFNGKGLFNSILPILVLLAFLSGHLQAAITFDAGSSVVSNTKTATSAAWLHTVGSGSNRILIVGVSIVDTTTNYVAGVNYGGAALTRIGTISRGTLYLTEMWYLLSPNSGTNTITVNMSNGASITAGAASFAGVNLSSPLGSFVSANGNNNNPTVDATTMAGDMVIDTITVNGSRTGAVGTGQTVRWNPAAAGGGGWAKGAGSTELATGGTATMSWTLNGKSNWTIGAVPIHAALTAPTTVKSFSSATIAINGATNMTITLTNPNATFVSGATFTDTYPSGMINTAAAPSSNTCGGTVTMTNGGNSLVLFNGIIPASGSCSIVVPITATAAGAYTNNTGAVTTASTLPGSAASATLTVLAPPIVVKDFSPNTVLINGAVNMTIMLTNPNTTAITGAAFTDTYPSTNMKNTASTPSSNTCGGTVIMTNGGSSLSLSNGTIPASGSCTIVVPVTATTAGNYINSTGNVTTTNAGTGTAASDTLVAVTAPTATKSFSPNIIPVSGASTMTITLINSNTTAITGVTFMDTYPSTNMKNTASAPLSNTCGGTPTMTNGGSSLALSGGTIPASSNCSIVVPITASIAGAYLNSTGTISADGPITIAAAFATLTAMTQPTAAKNFSPNVIPVSGASSMTITLTNPNATAITGVSFTDTYPSANMQNTASTPSSNTCGGTVTMTNGGSSLKLSGGIIPASGNCSIVVPITAVAADTYSNSTGTISTASAGTGAAASATLTAMVPPTVAKNFSPGTILPSGATNMTITLTNSNATAITGVSFTDNYPSGMTNTAGSPTSNTCGGTPTMANGGSSFGLSGGTIPASGSCSIVVPITATSYGSAVNGTGAITTTNAGTGTAGTATLTIIAPPVISKVFSTTVILPNGATTIAFDLSNPNTSTSITGVGFTDAYPANMKNTAGSPTTNTCDGIVTMSNGGASFAISGVTIAASGSCSIVVPVTATAAGAYNNSTGSVTSTNAGTGDGDTDTLTVMTAASAIKGFTPATIQTSAVSVLTITLNNPNTSNITNVAFTDTYPSNMVNTTSASPSTDCGGTATAANGGNSFSLSGGTIPASGSCTVTVNVTSAAAGVYPNSTGTISTTLGNITAASATLTVRTPPQMVLTKSADATTAVPGQTITYTVYYHNIGGMPASYLIVSDSIPTHTTYVAGSLKIGSAASTYASATSLTDTEDSDAGKVSGSSVIFTITSVDADDGASNSGADEGKVYFKVTVD